MMKHYTPPCSAKHFDAYENEFRAIKSGPHKHFTFEKYALAAVMSLCLLVMATA